MLTKSLLAIVLAACGVSSIPATAEQPDKLPPDMPPQEDGGQHFCCQTLDGDGSGDGCSLMSKDHILLCENILYCDGSWEKSGSKVKCIK